MSATPDSTLANPEQLIADLQRQLAQCRAERDEALQRETATAEVLQAINSSPGDLAPVFDAILEKAHSLCGVSSGSLQLYDGDKFRAVAVHGLAEGLAVRLREGYRPGRNLPNRRLLDGEAFVLIPDLAEIDDPMARSVVDLGGLRTTLHVALRQDETLLGQIVAARREVRSFSEKEIALLQNFAAQAVIAIENARLLTETREALEQQTATSEVLRVINSSPGDLTPVFDAMLEKAMRLCEAAFGGLGTWQGDRFAWVASRGLPQPFAEYIATNEVSVGPRAGFARVARGDGYVQFADISTSKFYRDGEPFTRAIVDLGGSHTTLSVPLVKDDAVLGVLGFFRQEIKPFSEKQIALVKNFAAQAVIAMENARLITETRDALEQQTATAEILQVINSSPGDLAPVFDAMLEKALHLCEAASGIMWSFDGERAYVRASRDVPTEFIDYIEREPPGAGPDTFFGRAILTRSFVTSADISAEAPYRKGVALPVGAVELGGIRAVLMAPLVKDNTVSGVFSIFRKEVRPFTDKQIALLENFAAQTVIAMENARLVTETREALEQQTATAEVLQVINSSPGDLAPVFEVILEKAHTRCGAAHGSLQLYDGENLHAVATNAVSDEFADILRQGYRAVDSPASHALIHGKPFAHIADCAEIDHPVFRSAAELAGIRTVLFVPLRKDGAFLGLISAARLEVRPFSEKEIALLQNFAAQAVIAMENARLLGELRQRTDDLQESLEYQTATSDVLKVISGSAFDLQPVLDTLLQTAARLCQAEMGGVAIRAGKVFHYLATTSYNPEFDAFLRARPFLADRSTMAGRVALEGQIVHIVDAATDPEYNLPELLTVGGIRTLLGVPLMREGEPAGVITLCRQNVEPFTQRQIELVETFADQAVIAIENARLLGELQARTDELTRSVAELQALEEVLRAVNSSLDLDTVLATIISRAAQLSQADEGTIYEFDETEEVFVPKSAFGMTAERVEVLRERKVRLGETHLGRAALKRAPVHVDDVQQDSTLSGPDRGGLLEGIHAVLAVPLMREDKVVGGLVIRRRTVGGFAQTIPTLLQTFAGQAVLAIENARLFQELGRRGEEARRAHAAAEAALADLRRAQARLIQAEKMASLGQLTAGIAHEIKNPLNFVNNFAGLSVELLDELKETAAPAVASLGDDTRAEVDEIFQMLTGNLEKIAEHGRRADGIVKSMLEHSRGESGERREVDLNGLVEEALNLAYHGARAQDQNFTITLECELDHSIAPIELVPQDMTRVFLNLFGNGFYASAKRRREEGEANFRPVLKVTTRDLGEAVEIRVRDNGTGIAPEIRDKLFQPFFTTKPTGEGTGLGLSISYDIVTQQHGGMIEVDSRVGEFTEFAIRLPRMHRITAEAAS